MIVWIIIIILILWWWQRRVNSGIVLYNPKATHCMIIPGTMRLLSFNIFMWPNHQNDRFQRFLKLVKYYDVLVLQEMFFFFTNRQRKLLQQTYPYAVIGKTPHFIDSGIVTISKYPIIATDSHIFTMGTYWEGLTPRQILWTLLPHAHIFNTHLQATHAGMANSRYSEMVRAKQIEELSEFIRWKISLYPHLPAFVCGDLNMKADSVEYIRTMDMLGGIDLFPKHDSTFPEESICIDYIILISERKSTTTTTINTMDEISDHYGLSLTWEKITDL
jgi:endonuclease/exonuclease/phosphatase family metal-dependent hydrolase